jgi:Ca2+-binding EF-hand superfamily protein
LERELESSKVALTLKPDFNLHDAFRIFDHHHHGSISVADVRDGLAAIGVFPTSEEADLFFKRYDSDSNLRINFHEFGAAFLSQDSYYSHMLNRRPSNNRHPLYRRDDCFYSDT